MHFFVVQIYMLMRIKYDYMGDLIMYVKSDGLKHLAAPVKCPCKTLFEAHNLFRFVSYCSIANLLSLIAPRKGWESR